MDEIGLMEQPPLDARHVELSALASADDDVGPSPRLVELGLEAAGAARRIDLTHLTRRLEGPPWWPDIWPGEHYRLLAGLVAVMNPLVVVEIGTATGLSALALLERLPANGRVVTFDILPWSECPGGVLREDDLSDGRLVQHVDDLSDEVVAERYGELLADAGLIFVDAAKDGWQERQFLDLFERTPFKHQPIVVFDDIRLWNMLDIWRNIRRPKLDLTSFGHWSGTGLVDFG